MALGWRSVTPFLSHVLAMKCERETLVSRTREGDRKTLNRVSRRRISRLMFPHVCEEELPGVQCTLRVQRTCLS